MKQEDVIIMENSKAFSPCSDTYNRSLEEIMEISLRPKEYVELVENLRVCIRKNSKEDANEILDKIKNIVGEDDPFLVTARIALDRMD